MTYSKSLVLLFIIIIILFQSCNNNEQVEPIDFGYDYFPLEVGKYIEYDVDSTIYDYNFVSNYDVDVYIRNNSIQVREEVSNSFTNADGQLVYRLERFERKDETEAWQLDAMWTVVVVNDQLELTDENDQRFIKMVFPVSEDTAPWDGNQYIEEEAAIGAIYIFKHWQYRYDEISESIGVGTFNFDDVATVYQANEENFIELRRSYEQYARGIGLIKREMFILDTQCITECLGQSWEEKAWKGFILKQTVRDYN